MDINEQFYFVATRIDSEQQLKLFDGVDFHGGLRSSMPQLDSEHVFLIDESGNHQVSGTLQLVHLHRRGYVLELSGQKVLSFPCLLTTDSKMQWAFSGGVIVKTNDSDFEAAELSASGIPLAGESWVGMLRRIENEMRLDVYSKQNAPLGPSLKAYCPDWSEGFDDDALIFTIDLCVPV